MNRNPDSTSSFNPISKLKTPGPRRISYTLPLATHTPKWFSLPSIDAEKPTGSNPLLIEANHSSSSDQSQSQSQSTQFHPTNPYSRHNPSSNPNQTTHSHPKHTLAVTCLAVDSSTCISGYGDEPQGILYTGGRDGLIASWELRLKMRKRRKRNIHHQQPQGDWENVESSQVNVDGSREQEEDEEEEEEEEDSTLPLESKWQVDPDKIPVGNGPKSTFRQCIQSHTDWVNDIVLCNQNQTLISASSDHTIKLWNPHDQSSSLAPHSLGSHKDYVKCLSLAREASIVASGGFDQLIKIWSLKELRDFPLLTIPSSETFASIYALSINPSGSIIAAGTPEKKVKVWDSRSGKTVSNLIGHTDNIRSVLISDDGRHLLSSSSDSTVRLWSLGEQRCLHTFNHHSSSVWSLASNDPNLDVFYSGDKDGWICKVDWERCSEVAEGECVVLARDGEEDEDDHDQEQDSNGSTSRNGRGRKRKNRGVHKIVALDDSYLWTATGSSNVNRWKDVRPRSERESLYPIGSSTTTSSRGLLSHSDSLSKNISKIINNQDSSSSSNPKSTLSQVTNNHGIDSPTSGTATPVNSKSNSKTLEEQEEEDELLNETLKSKAKLFGIPFDSLVCLSPPNDPYETVGLGSASIMSVNRSLRGIGFGDQSQLPIPASSWRSNNVLGRPSLDQRSTSGTNNVPTTATAGPSAISPSNSSHLRPESLRSASIKFARFGNEPLSSSSPREDWGMVNERQSIDVNGNDPLLSIVDHEDDDDDVGSEDDLAYESRLAYEERELAEDAIPLRRKPNETIKGSHGLIRSTMLNDRRHVLTIDTEGKVSLWDIIAGVCLGAFVQKEINETVGELSKGGDGGGDRLGDSNSNRFTPGEVLELVKERIEGQGSAVTWSSIDTRSGALSVHLEQQRCFDAEIYWDECDSIVDVDQHKEDQRVNIGKWVLRQLLDGFVTAEERLRNSDQLAPGQLAIEKSSSLDHDKFTQEPMEELSSTSESFDPNQPLHTPGATIGIASPAKNPALTPLGSSPLTPSGSKGLGSVLGVTSKIAGSEDSKPDDYFSSKETENNNNDATPSSPPATPSASNGLMGRFKFGLKSPKVEKALATAKPVEKTSEVKAEEDSPYMASLRALLQKPLNPPSISEAPPIPFSPSISVVVSESSPDASTWEVVYRGLIKTQALDVGALELFAPFWCLDYVLKSRITGQKEMPKLSFVLNPFNPPPSSEKDQNQDQGGQMFEPMKELPSGNARLTATRLLRMKKISTYVCEKLGLSSPRSRNNSIAGSRRSSTDAGNALSSSQGSALSMTALAAKAVVNDQNTSSSPPKDNQTNGTAASNASISSSSSSTTPAHTQYLSLLAQGIAQPHECVEILVNGKVLPPNATLAQCQRFWWRTPEDIKLEYRWKRSGYLNGGQDEGDEGEDEEEG